MAGAARSGNPQKRRYLSPDMHPLKVLLLSACLICSLQDAGSIPAKSPGQEREEPAQQETSQTLVVVKAPLLYTTDSQVVSAQLQVKDSRGHPAPLLTYGPGKSEELVYGKPVYGNAQDLAYPKTRHLPDKVIFQGVKYVRKPQSTSAPGHHPDTVLPYLGGHAPGNYGTSVVAPYSSRVYVAPYGLDSGLELYGVRSAPWTLSSKWLKRSTPVYSSVYTGPANQNKIKPEYR